MKIKSFLAVSMIALGAISFSFNGVAADKNTNSKMDTNTPQPSVEEMHKISEDDIVMGDSNAPVTIIEYASMTCSHCADFHKNVYPEIKKNYIDTGKVKLVLRAFPLDRVALQASKMATCAGKDRFYKFTDVLFTTQSNWAFSKNHLEVLSNIGKLGGLDGAEFDKCLADTDLETRIMQGKLNAARVLGVRATPSFFINGHKYKGAYKVKAFSEILDSVLSGKPQVSVEAAE